MVVISARQRVVAVVVVGLVSVMSAGCHGRRTTVTDFVVGDSQTLQQSIATRLPQGIPSRAP